VSALRCGMALPHVADEGDGVPTNMSGGVKGGIKIEPLARGEKVFVVKCR
jgi:hypothetical protein